MILIVDDRQENLFSLKNLLQLHGYRVDIASSGEEALKKILKIEYELIVLDVQMPQMDGYEVAEAISGFSKSKEIPILFLSAVHIDKRFITRGFESGGVDYITKPFDPELLLLKIRTFSRLYNQKKELNDIRATLEQKVNERTSELQQTNLELQQSNYELQQYAAVASHDLQEPLRKIITFSNILNDRCLESFPEAGQYTHRIIYSAERMRKLINDLLNYSKISISDNVEQGKLPDVLRQVLSDLEIQVMESGAIISVESLPAVQVPYLAMSQVFQNLISNSLKFTRVGVAPRINIRGEWTSEKSVTAPVAEHGPFLRVYVKDNGRGFNELYKDKIFTMFQRLHPAEYEGTGIGLSIVKKIIENMRGCVTAQSEPDKGSTFIFTIPVNSAANGQNK